MGHPAYGSCLFVVALFQSPPTTPPTARPDGSSHAQVGGLLTLANESTGHLLKCKFQRNNKYTLSIFRYYMQYDIFIYMEVKFNWMLSLFIQLVSFYTQGLSVDSPEGCCVPA